jgi:hypothetical protein
MTITKVLTGKALTLRLGTAEYHQQTTLARIDSEPVTETVSPLGVDPVNLTTGTQRTLNLTALQDWPESDSLMGLLADAAASGTLVQFTLELTNAAGDVATAAGSVQGVEGPFGGEAGVLTGDLALPVVVWAGIVQTPNAKTYEA